MKKLLRFAVLMVAVLIIGISMAFGADPAATAPAAPSLTDWIMVNKAAIFGLCLAISEFLSLIPGFHGNGILDTIIKGLRLLTGKQQAS